METVTSPPRSSPPRSSPPGSSFLDHPRTTRLAVALVVALGLAFLVSTLGGSGSNAASGRIGGDYPAFYAAGKIVIGGHRDQLYDLARHQAEQKNLFGDDHSDGVVYFPYPPFLAAAYAPLAALPYKSSYLVHTAMMALALLLSLRLIRPMIPILDRRFALFTAFSFGFYPMFRAVTGGQNTALTLFLLAWSWRAAHDGNDGWAGVALGLLLYKPQYAVPVLGLHVVVRRWRTVAAACVTAVPLWLVSAVLFGPGWLSSWWQQVSRYAAKDALVNASNAISFLGLGDNTFGVGNRVGRAIAGSLVLVTGAALAMLWWRSSRASDRFAGNGVMAATIAGILLVSPHSMFYDAGLLVAPLIVLVEVLPARHHRWLALGWVVALSQTAADWLGWSPLFALVVAVFVAAVAAAAREGSLNSSVVRHRALVSRARPRSGSPGGALPLG